mmetsp:Transcript_132308/g.382516  ORF Transcript_132308/g.382516 Transcript_132308/m.382516 type:complete len:225 (-) Transcript_132308:144-818(-)
MPKVTNRCRRRVNHETPLPTMSASLMAAPRKVSFEDNFPDYVETSESSLGTLHEVPDLVLRPARTKSSLTRPKSSLSLVDLAVSGQGDSHEPPQKGYASAPVSPSISPVTASLQPSYESSLELPSSPWGQFVEMSASAEEEHAVHSLHHSIKGPCSCCSSCRRRRCNPYGCYQSMKKTRNEPPHLLGDGNWSKTNHHGGFRLNQKRYREPAEHIIGAFHRLQVE